jgi:hypothetical protein
MNRITISPAGRVRARGSKGAQRFQSTILTGVPDLAFSARSSSPMRVSTSTQISPAAASHAACFEGGPDTAAKHSSHPTPLPFARAALLQLGAVSADGAAVDLCVNEFEIALEADPDEPAALLGLAGANVAHGVCVARSSAGGGWLLARATVGLARRASWPIREPDECPLPADSHAHGSPRCARF